MTCPMHTDQIDSGQSVKMFFCTANNAERESMENTMSSKSEQWRVEIRLQNEKCENIEKVITYFDTVADAAKYASDVSGLAITGRGHYRSRNPSRDIDLVGAEENIFRVNPFGRSGLAA